MKIEIFYSKSIMDPYFKPISELEYEKVDQNDHFCDGDDKRVMSHINGFLEAIFKTYNLGTRAQRIGKRSMCVGDVVIFDSEQAFYCDSVGWKDVTRQMIPSGSDSIGFKEV